ncbi:MAG TPA: hypothetical protein VF898_09055 [Chloroflexota bacterium]
MRRRTKSVVQLAIAAVVAIAMMGAFVAVGGVSGSHSQIVLAKGGKGTGPGGTKPGWGCGDTNHTHTGPPGNPSMTSPCGSATGTGTGTGTTTATTTTGTTTGGVGTRPGWGCGDQNHTHTGPPGNQSMTSPCGTATDTTTATTTDTTTTDTTTATGTATVHTTKKHKTKKHKTKKHTKTKHH